MANILKGNYKLRKEQNKQPAKKASTKGLTEQFEEAALSKLGGSLCFVTKGKTFVWTGDEGEEARS